MPHIEIHEQGSIRVLDDLSNTLAATALSVLAEFWRGYTIYEQDGTVLTVAPIVPLPKRSIWRTVAAQLYNPVMDVEVCYVPQGRFSVVELKQRIARAVTSDDDILTQFMGRSEILAQLGQTSTYEDVVQLLRRMTTDG